MSTGYKNVTGKRMADLGARGEMLFHAADLARLWNIQNHNTMYTTLKRYAKAGLLYRIYKGLYSLAPVNKLDPYLLGLKALHRYAYVSLETILFQEGYISQPPQVITLISSISKSFAIGTHHYVCRRIKDQALFNPIGFDSNAPYFRATPERAIADLLYLRPHAAFDTEWRIRWDEVKQIQGALSYPLTPSRYAADSRT